MIEEVQNQNSADIKYMMANDMFKRYLELKFSPVQRK